MKKTDAGQLRDGYLETQPEADHMKIEGIAGQKMEVGQFVYRGDDGKYYLATTKGYAGIAGEAIKPGDTIMEDPNRPGHFRPVR